MPTFVEISAADLDALASGRDDGPAVATLLRAEYSRRALLLRVIARRVAAGHGESAPALVVDRAFDLLGRAERCDPAAVRRLLLYPAVGEWAVRTVRSLAEPVHTDAYRHLVHTATIAASAAIGVVDDFAIPVPIRSGRVALPMRGTARLEGEPDGFVHVVSTHGRVSVKGRSGHVELPTDRRVDTDGWRALRAVDGLSGGHVFGVLVDDQDPYRHYDGLVPATGLDDDALAVWHETIQSAWRLLGRDHAEIVPSLSTGLRCVVPLDGDTAGLSATSGDAFGAAALCLPRDSLELALGLVHEFQHSKLSALLHVGPLHAGDDGARYYAPWRNDPRPLAGLLQGCYAFMGVAGFWRSQRRSRSEPGAADSEFARWREQAWRTTNVLLASGALTPVGRRFVEVMRRTLRRWREDPVPPLAMRVARLASLDHRLTWRLRNLEPDPVEVTDLAAAWVRRRPCPAVARRPAAIRLRPLCPAAGLSAALLRRQLMDVAGGASPEEVDGLLARGRYGEAAALYAEQIAGGARDALSWAGLGVASGESGGRGRTALLTRPELVRAVHRRVQAAGGPVAPDELAAWLAPSCRDGV